MGKGEIARSEQFLLFPQCFQKTCTADKYKPGLVWEKVNFHHAELSPFPDEKLLTSKLKEFADDNFKFDENGGKLC